MCPRCNSAEVRPSKKWKFTDILMRLWGMKPYRCKECQARFYLPVAVGRKVEAEHAWVREVLEDENSPRSRSRKARRKQRK
jgi:hypothetical protein